MKLNIEYDSEKEDMSSLAYSLGLALEKVIDFNTDQIRLRNLELESKIISYAKRLEGTELQKYIKHFELKTIVGNDN